MKKTILLSLSVLVLAGAPPNRVTAAPTNGANVSATPAEKLIDGADMMRGFLTGQTVRVIVNLASPPEALHAMEWNNKPKLRRWHGRVKGRQDEVLGAFDPHEFRLRRKFENQAGFSAEVTPQALQKLMNDPRVLSIEPVREIKQHLKQGLPLINATATGSTYQGAGMSIAIVDSGVDYTHPQLGGGGFPNSKVIGGTNFGDNIPDPRPNGNAHGTACAGIAAGNLATVGDYVGGVAPKARLYAIKITQGPSGSASTEDMVAAWDWCVTHKNDDPANPILVISTSFGGGRFLGTCDGHVTAMTTAANNAVAAGITVLASSGNEGYCNALAWPSCISSVISVGAVYDADFGVYEPCVTRDACATKIADSSCEDGYYVRDTTQADKVTSYSNTSPLLDLLAPGNSAYTTDIRGGPGDSNGDYVSTFGGTSAACPYAAGAVAALQSAAQTVLGRYLTPEEVRAKLIATGDMVTDTKVEVSKPRVNLGRAIQSLGTEPVSTNSVATLQNDVPVAGLSGAQASVLRFKILVPSGQSSLTVRTSGGTGNCNLYVKRGSVPNSSAEADGKSEGGTTTETVTLSTPAAADYYIVLFGSTAYANVTLTAGFDNAAKPELAAHIATPADGQSYSSLAEASGTASGTRLAQVWVALLQLSQSGQTTGAYDWVNRQWVNEDRQEIYVKASGTTSWSQALPPASALVPGAYAVLAWASDGSGQNFSPEAAARFTISEGTSQPPNDPLTARITTPVDGQSYSSLAQASGTASGDGLAKVLVLLVRLDPAGKVNGFYNWTNQTWGTNQLFVLASGTTSWSQVLPPASVLSAGRYALVVIAADSALQNQSSNAVAFFTIRGDVTDPPGGTVVPGKYNGLFAEPGGMRHESSGAFTLTVTASRAFTGKLIAAGKRYPVSGSFGPDGTATVTVKRSALSPLTLELAFAGDPGAEMVTGTVETTEWEAELTGYRAATTPTQLAPYVGKYTVLVPGNVGATDAPGGDGYGAITVDARGNLRLSGALADGSLLTQGAPITGEGAWPVYVSLYGGKGSLVGWMQLSAEGTRSVEGFLSWERPALARSRLYPEGFLYETDVVGSGYVPSGNAPALALQTGTLLVDAPSFDQTLELDVRMGAKNRLINNADNRTVFTISPSTGLFRGSIRHPQTGRPVAIKGAVLQDQNSASGFFLDGGQSGSVVLAE